MTGGVVLGTRGSPLALAQARSVELALRHKVPGLRITIQIVKTAGDKHVDAPAADSVRDGLLDKGMFTREIEDQLLEGKISIAVHSLKDLPTQQPPGLDIAGCLPRAAVRDVLVMKCGADGQAASGTEAWTIATGSLRRCAQLKTILPGVRTVDVRGNVATRLGKLVANPEWNGLVLARAGLERLGYYDNAPSLQFRGCKLDLRELDEMEMLPAPGQGAIALQTRGDDTQTMALCRSIGHDETFVAVRAERAWLAAMGGGCQAPLAAYAAIAHGKLRLVAGDFRNGRLIREIIGETEAPDACGEALARMFASD